MNVDDVANRLGRQ